MKINPLALLPLLVAAGGAADLQPLPLNADDFDQPAWETIIELAFPPWAVPAAGCPRLDALGGALAEGNAEYPAPEDGKFNPCYYTKAFASLDPKLGGYPSPIDTHYPYEHAAPFLRQPGDGSVHHCPAGSDPLVNVGSCPKLGHTCGKDCAVTSDAYGIGHVPPFVPLAAVKEEYAKAVEAGTDICGAWFHYPTSGCNIRKSALDVMVWEHFGQEEEGKIKFEGPKDPSSKTYYRLEYIGAAPECDGNCFGPHYCTADVAADGRIWGDFCPYVHTGENSGKYRHPHVALAALELWIANQCLPDDCPSTWLDSPNGQGYGAADDTSTSITWSEMKDNDDPMSQPAVPYVWPNAGDGVYPGLNLYGGKTVKGAPGFYVNEVVGGVDVEEDHAVGKEHEEGDGHSDDHEDNNEVSEMGDEADNETTEPKSPGAGRRLSPATRALGFLLRFAGF